MLFTFYTPVYATITAVCTIFLYVSYVVPCALGSLGPWKKLDHHGTLEPWRLVSAPGDLECPGLRRLIVVGIQPPNQKSGVGRCRLRAGVLGIVLGSQTARHRFPGAADGEDLMRAKGALLIWCDVGCNALETGITNC